MYTVHCLLYSVFWLELEPTWRGSSLINDNKGKTSPGMAPAFVEIITAISPALRPRRANPLDYTRRADWLVLVCVCVCQLHSHCVCVAQLCLVANMYASRDKFSTL